MARIEIRPAKTSLAQFLKNATQTKRAGRSESAQTAKLRNLLTQVEGSKGFDRILGPFPDPQRAIAFTTKCRMIAKKAGLTNVLVAVETPDSGEKATGLRRVRMANCDAQVVASFYASRARRKATLQFEIGDGFDESEADKAEDNFEDTEDSEDTEQDDTEL